MADRFYSEGSDRTPLGANEPREPQSYYPKKSQELGDFSENIDSKGAPTGATPGQKTQKFQLHIEGFDDFMASPTGEIPHTVKSEPVKAPVRQPQQTAAKSPVQQTRAASSRSGASSQKGKAPVKKAVAKKTAPAKTKLTKEQMARKKARRRYDFTKGILITSVCAIFITIITAAVSTVALSFINDILVIDKNANKTVLVDIPEGAEYEEVFEILKDSGLVKQPVLTNFFLKFRHYDEIDVKDKNGNIVTKRIQYEPGKYYLERNAGIETNIESIMVKKNVSKDTVRLTFPEGWSVAQIFEKIEKYEVCTADKLYANLDIIAEQYSFISNIVPVTGRYLKAEGYLFPDTYDFYIDESASSVLKKLFDNFQNKWTAEYEQRAKELGKTVDEIINIAAIIQREADNNSQMAVISSVIHNRLKSDSTLRRLEMDSTKKYIPSLEQYGILSKFYLDFYSSAYNTYNIEGLPPGPICNPSISAIKAALYPADTNYYYFCHNISTGELFLARNWDEHVENLRKSKLR